MEIQGVEGIPIRVRRGETSSTFANLHPVEFSMNLDLDVAMESIELLRARTDASSSFPALFSMFPCVFGEGWRVYW